MFELDVLYPIIGNGVLAGVFSVFAYYYKSSWNSLLATMKDASGDIKKLQDDLYTYAVNIEARKAGCINTFAKAETVNQLFAKVDSINTQLARVEMQVQTMRQGPYNRRVEDK